MPRNGIAGSYGSSRYLLPSCVFSFCLWFLLLCKSFYVSVGTIYFCWEADQKRYCCYSWQRVFCPCFQPRVIVSSLRFRCLIHFAFIFMYGIRECLNFILLRVTVQCSQHHWGDCLFSTVYSCPLGHRLVDHRCMGLPLGFLCCSTEVYFCFRASTKLF